MKTLRSITPFEDYECVLMSSTIVKITHKETKKETRISCESYIESISENKFIIREGIKLGRPFEGAKLKLICETCGKEFERFRSLLKGDHHFCSTKCVTIVSEGRVILGCHECGIEFERKRSKVGKGKVFCSAACHQKNRKK